MMRHVTEMSQPFVGEESLRAGPAGKRCGVVGRIAVAAFGLAVLVGCGDDGKEDACSELRAELDELESRFTGVTTSRGTASTTRWTQASGAIACGPRWQESGARPRASDRYWLSCQPERGMERDNSVLSRGVRMT